MISRARGSILLGACLVVWGHGDAAAIEWKAIEPLVFGGRFQYVTSLERQSVPFAWNTTTQSAEDLTRLMLDLTADTHYGDLYVKGSAVWDDTRPSQVSKLVTFGQGDYLWKQHLQSVDYSIHLFANERRFITHDMIAPLLHDDLVGNDSNVGGRFDTTVKGSLGATLLYSALGGTHEAAREITYVRAAYAGWPVVGSVSYVLDHPGVASVENHAVFKAEVSTSYKRAHAVVSYHQAAYSGQSVFFPSGGPSGSGGAVCETLPENGALFAELRLRSVRLANAGHLKFLCSYACVGESFYNDLGLAKPAQEATELATYFSAATVDLRARVAYGTSKRSHFESEETRRWHATLWGRLANQMDFSARGELVDSRTSTGYGSFVDLMLQKQLKKVRSGVHVMWKDVDTIFSDTRFAWDGSLAASPNWGLYWRFLVNEQFDVGDMLFARLSYRPNNSIFFTFSYGRQVIGDGPHLLEDQDVELSRFGTALYTILLRGDF